MKTTFSSRLNFKILILLGIVTLGCGKKNLRSGGSSDADQDDVKSDSYINVPTENTANGGVKGTIAIDAKKDQLFIAERGGLQLAVLIPPGSVDADKDFVLEVTPQGTGDVRTDDLFLDRLSLRSSAKVKFHNAFIKSGAVKFGARSKGISLAQASDASQVVIVRDEITAEADVYDLKQGAELSVGDYNFFPALGVRVLGASVFGQTAGLAATRATTRKARPATEPGSGGGPSSTVPSTGGDGDEGTVSQGDVERCPNPRASGDISVISGDTPGDCGCSGGSTTTEATFSGSTQV